MSYSSRMKQKRYGRQAEGKTIKSLSMDSDVAEWVEREAAAKGVSVSAFINDFLIEHFEKQGQKEKSDKGKR